MNTNTQAAANAEPEMFKAGDTLPDGTFVNSSGDTKSSSDRQAKLLATNGIVDAMKHHTDSLNSLDEHLKWTTNYVNGFMTVVEDKRVDVEAVQKAYGDLLIALGVVPVSMPTYQWLGRAAQVVHQADGGWYGTEDTMSDHINYADSWDKDLYEIGVVGQIQVVVPTETTFDISELNLKPKHIDKVVMETGSRLRVHLKDGMYVDIKGHRTGINEATDWALNAGDLTDGDEATVWSIDGNGTSMPINFE